MRRNHHRCTALLLLALLAACAADRSDVPAQRCDEAERCDGLDDDCDGVVDEGFGLGAPCVVGQGGCVASGVVVCGVDGEAAACGARAGEPSAEVCQGGGLDEDCDGAVDEGCACDDGQTQPCGSDEGACKAGLQSCSNGQWNACVGARGPGPELCDGLDQDCDGEVDEGVCAVDLGCSDLGRDAFLDVARFPDVAGCSGGWLGRLSLRAGRASSAPCGDELGVVCGAPAELCASGWEVCAADGRLAALTRALDGASCYGAASEQPDGAWLAASSHCGGVADGVCVPSTEPLACAATGLCAEPICCGSGCRFGMCINDVFPGGTRFGGEPMEVGCADFPGDAASGVLCCRLP